MVNPFVIKETMEIASKLEKAENIEDLTNIDDLDKVVELAASFEDNLIDEQSNFDELDTPFSFESDSFENDESHTSDDIENNDLDKVIESTEQLVTISRTIETRNSSLEGDIHPITGVPFERQVIEYDGETIEGVFPEFESQYDVQLSENLYEASNKRQFDYANAELKVEVDANPDFASQFNTEQLEQIQNGDRPDGYVWHHSEEPGKLQLVDKEIHDQTGHTGGQVIWGGGNDNR